MDKSSLIKLFLPIKKKKEKNRWTKSDYQEPLASETMEYKVFILTKNILMIITKKKKNTRGNKLMHKVKVVTIQRHDDMYRKHHNRGLSFMWKRKQIKTNSKLSNIIPLSITSTQPISSFLNQHLLPIVYLYIEAGLGTGLDKHNI